MQFPKPRSGHKFLDDLRTSGALVLIPGGALTLLGVVAVMSPLLTGIETGDLVGFLLLTAGAFRAAFALRARRPATNVLGLVIAGLNVLGGLLLLGVSAGGDDNLAPMLAILLLADGLLSIALALQMRDENGWGWLLASAWAALVLGTMILYKWPALLAGSAVVALGLFLALAGASIANLGAREE